jgi:MFS family permease
MSIVLIPFAFISASKEETVPEEKNVSQPKKESVLAMLLKYKKTVLCTIAITAFSAVGFYTLLTFLPYYLVREGILKLDQATNCSIISNISIISSATVFGYLSDIFKRKPFLLGGMIGVVVVTYFIFLSEVNSFGTWKIVHAVYGLFFGMYFSSRAAFFSEAFPKNVRCTGVSLSMSLAQAVVGGSTPMILNYCTSISGAVSIIPITVVAVGGMISLCLIKDRTGQNLQ